MKNKLLGDSPITRRHFMKMAGAGAAALAALPSWLQAATSGPGRKPNILLVITDDVGWGDFRCYNPQGKIPTPSIDRIAQSGMRFTDAHSASGVCAPSRYSLLTGNYPWRGREAGGVWNYNTGSDMLPGQKTVGAILHDADYRTAIYGKLGIGTRCASKPGKTAGSVEFDWEKPLTDGPNGWGFDYSYVLLQGHQGAPYMFFENGRVDGDISKIINFPKPVDPKPDLEYKYMIRGGPGLPDWDCRQIGERLIRKTEQFLDAHAASNKAEGRERPFYIHLSTAGAHTPYMPPQAIRGTPVAGVSHMTGHTDMVVEADVVVGKLMEVLEKRGLQNDTLIVVTSDNGGIHRERQYGHDAVAGLRGGKSSVWEGGHRVPLIARWGDGTARGSKIPPGTVSHQMVAIHDMVATFAELAGAKAGPDQARDSFSLAAVLWGKRGDDRPVRTTLISQSHFGPSAQLGEPAGNRPVTPRKASEITGDDMAHGFREGTWKLTFDADHTAVALHDLARDLGENNNLINDPTQAARIERMVQEYVAIRRSRRSAPVIQ